jgi:pimeloyl-ACP methyl ester carboxylesterase
MPTIKTRDVTLYYEEEGSGPALLLLPAMGTDLGFFASLRQELRHDLRLVLMDNRGSGRSEKPRGPYSIEAMADDAAAVLDHLGVQRAAVFGISLGGCIAQMTALRHAQRVDRLFLCGTFFSGRPDKLRMPGRIVRLIMESRGTVRDVARRSLEVSLSAAFIRARPDLVDELVERRVKNPVVFRGFDGQRRAFLDFDVEGRLAGIQCPAAVLHGELDEIMPLERGRELHAALSGSSFHVLGGAGHLFFIEQPAATAEIILEAMGRGPRPRA